ncbi:MAG: transcriptional regulator [Cardiobacteriales bacterium]|nr:MAG: transcriptional regulator [Cardiobacteriales bacterium]
MQDASYQKLLDLLCRTNDKEKISALLDALLTDKEKKELINRLKIFSLLEQGVTQREISSTLGVGIATVSRGAKAFQQYRMIDLLADMKNTPK